MSAAVLTLTTHLTPCAVVREVVLDCSHGITRVSALTDGGDSRSVDRCAIRAALIRHVQEQRCECIRKLWAHHFDAPLGEVVLVRGKVPA